MNETHAGTIDSCVGENIGGCETTESFFSSFESFLLTYVFSRFVPFLTAVAVASSSVVVVVVVGTQTSSHPPPRSTSIPSTLHFPSPTPTAQIIQPVATIGYNRGQKQQTRPNQQRPLKRPHKKANCQSEPKRTTTTTRSCRTGHK